MQSKKDLLDHLETHGDRKSRTKRTAEKHKCDLCHSEFTMKKSLDRTLARTRAPADEFADIVQLLV